MKTKLSQSFSNLAAPSLLLAAFFVSREGALAQFPAQGDDLTQSLGQYNILVNPTFQPLMAGYPGYNSTSKVLTSPILYDPTTVIGRSNPLLDGSASDGSGVPVGTAGTIISDGNFSVQPAGQGPANTREVHTQIRSLNMTGGGAAVRAGTNATSQGVSPGEVESWSGASLNPVQDFPARSFFDVFVEVDIPSGGSFPGATSLTNSMPLMIQNTNLTSFPPQVVYVHGMSTAVPVKFSSTNPGHWIAGDTFGVLTLAGHGVFQTNNSTGNGTTVGAATTQLQNTLAATPPAPVEPPANTWGPGVATASTNNIFPGLGDDVTTSLGTFRIAVNPAFQAALTSVGYPGWNSGTKRLTSPLLYDPSTKIGRSSALTNGSAADTNGLPVGTAGTVVADTNLTLYPPLFDGPAGTREVHTEIRSLNLSGGGASVDAGTAAPGTQKSLGEVQSLSGNSGDPYWDFPAKSFFDVFVDVTLPASGAFPSVTLSNIQPLIVENNTLTTFPPKVIYTHGNSTAVPVVFTQSVPALGANAGDTFGILLLAGHGVGYNQSNSNDVAQFQQQMNQMQELPVAPAYSNWAPGLKVPASNTPAINLTCSTNITVTAGTSNGVSVFYTVTATGGCSAPMISANPPSGTVFPVGTTTVYVSASDTCGNSANCSFTVTVNPPYSPPMIICPSNIVTNNGSTNGAIVNFTVQTSGGCAPVTVYTSPYNSGTVFPLGTTYEYADLYDCNGYETSCSFSVTVTDTNVTPLVVTCPTNITVSATSPSGAIVDFGIGSSGGCPGSYTYASPYYSGYTFPVGTTTEYVYGYDPCTGLYSNYCTFTVTVNPPPSSATIPEYFSPGTQAVIPPPNSVYISPALWHALYNNGIVIRDVRHRFFTQNYPVPALNNTTTETFSSEVDCQLSTDGGATFQPASGTANVTVQVTHSYDSSSTSFFNTVMQQLDLKLGAVMVRVDPGQTSTGETTVRPENGGFMISSFFDIFTDVSLDGGNTWTPANGPAHVEMHPDPKVVAPSPEPTPLLPPPNDHYISPSQWHALYAQGIVIRNVSHRLFTGSLLPPAQGTTNHESINSVLDLQYSTDGGNTFQSARVTAPVQITVANASSSSDNTMYDTVMNSLSATLPGGIMIRASQTESSRGETEIDAQPDGTFHISSFFDIFTELSLDGGNTWSPASNGPVRMQLTQQAPEVTNSTGNLPVTGSSYVSPAQWHALFANGIVLTNVSHDRFTQTQTPPGSGGSSTESFGSQVSGQISMNGGNTFQPFTAPGNVTIQVNSDPGLDNGSTRYFDTQMTQLDVSGGTLPSGVMIRQSQTQPSLGSTSIRTDTNGGFHISSFFDVFTELSLDGGNTWSPTLSGPGTMSPGSSNSTPQLSVNCPSNITVTASSSSGAVVFFTATASGGCSTPNVVANPPSGSTFPIGMTTVFVAASDTCNNSADCSFTVTVQAPPISLNCPSNITTSASSSSGAYVYFNPTASGGCSSFPNVYASPPSGSLFPLGTTPVYVTASDTCGNSTNCSFSVTVTNAVYPLLNINCPSNITVTATGGSGGATVFYSVTASGGCSPPPYLYSYPPSGSTFAIGTTTVNSTASDTCGNSTNCSFSVTVNAPTNPPIVLNCPSNITTTATGPSGATVFFNATASGGCSPPPMVMANPPSGSTFPIGTTMVFTTASDTCGNSTNCSFQVTVNPATNNCTVSIYCPSNIVMTSSVPTTVFFTVTASDTCGGTPTVNSMPPSGSTFPIGTTMVNSTAYDSHGTNMCSFMVTVVKPNCQITVNCPTNIVVTAGGPTNVFFTVTASDTCGGIPTVNSVPPSGSTFPIGTTMVNSTAYDANGTNMCSFSVTVVKTNANCIVSINCPQNITVSNTGSAVVFFTVTASDTCGGIPTVNSVPPSGSTFPIGTTMVNSTAYDANGTNMCSFSVTVIKTNANCVVSINCPSNIVVASSSPVPVFFTVTASDTCGGIPNVVANPPSGSTFPIGITTVFSTAYDANGTNMCSFTVTVNRATNTTPLVNEYYTSVSNSLPPINTVYISPAQWHALYNNGIVIRDVRHRFFTQNFAPPTLGNTATESFGSELDFSLSTDGGNTFNPTTGTANVTVQVTHNQDVGGISFYNTVMLQLNLTGPGFMLRIDPGEQSTGQTTIRPAPGGYMISSFFDIFTDVSLDGGNTWTPAQGPGHVEMRPDPLQVPGTGEPTPLLPAPVDAYVSPAQWHALYAQGIVIRNVSHKLFTGSLLPPPPGATNNESFNSVLDLDVSTDGGKSFQSVRATNCPVQITVANSSSSTDNPIYDTEMTSMNLQLPGSGIMLRESPTQPSRGMTEIDPQGNGTFHITSFFDIFTELSLDGGNTWSPATNGPVRVQLTPKSPQVTTTGGSLPLTNRPYVSPAQWHAAYKNGIYITNVTHRAFTANYPPPARGATNTESFNSMVDGMISLNGGATFQPFTAPASVTVNVTSRSNLDNGNTRYFDTAMTSLNLSGGNLPGGVMVRQSPALPTLGRTSVSSNGPSSFMISSFFDIFTEVSLDGGNTWTPMTNQPAPMSPTPNCLVSIMCPPSITVTSVGPAVVTFVVTASDTCGNLLTVVSTPPSGSIFPEGTTTVTNTASNADGTNFCTFTITVKAKQRVFPSGGKLPPTNSIYISPAQWHAAFNNGIYISNVVHRAFTANFPPPTTGTSSNETFGSKVDFWYSTDGGHTFQKYTGNANCTINVQNTGTSGNGTSFQTHMTQLDLSGGNMPSNMKLRVDPNNASTGQTLITPTGTGTFQISSFFDIFVDLSLDGGNTWTPSTSSGHMELHIDPANPPTSLMQPQIQGTHLGFNVPTQPGLLYTVQYSSDLTSNVWTTLTAISGNGQSLSVSDALVNNPGHRFYRVLITEDPNQ